jgi:hypothetical protein
MLQSDFQFSLILRMARPFQQFAPYLLPVPDHAKVKAKRDPNNAGIACPFREVMSLAVCHKGKLKTHGRVRIFQLEGSTAKVVQLGTGSHVTQRNTLEWSQIWKRPH